MSNVLPFTKVTALDKTPLQILRGAEEVELEGVVIIGYTKDGEEFFASTYADGGTVIWLMERTKLKLLRTGETE